MRLKNALFVSAVALVGCIPLLITPTSNASAPVIDETSNIRIVAQGSDENSGWVAFETTAPSRGEIQPARETGTYPGGGRWIYGSYLTNNNQTEVCYSRYWHPTVTHSSTAYLAYSQNEPGVVKAYDTKGPGIETDAWLAGTPKVCYAFWNKA